MYVLNLKTGNVLNGNTDVVLVKDEEVLVANVDDLAIKVPGTKLLLELYNKRTGESVKKFSSRGQGLNRLWKSISDGSTISAYSAKEAAKSAKATFDPAKIPDGEDKAALKKRLKKERKVSATKSPAKKVKAEKGPGKRTSAYAGKKLIKKLDTNPRRHNTHGWRSWEAIRSGGTYEEAIANGARRVDIAWDVRRGRLEAA